MTEAEARARFSAARVARLATVGPHLVPICFAVDGDTIWSAIDGKPKRTSNLRRIRNITEDPRVAVLADQYEDDDWSQLWWVRADGEARVVDSDDGALSLLVERYPQYAQAPPPGPLIAIEVQRWSGWSADPAS